MADLLWYQYALIAVIFAWTGFVRSGLGFGGAILSLPFLLLITDDPLIFLPIITVHLLFFVALNEVQKKLKQAKSTELTKPDTLQSNPDWKFLKYALAIMIIPKIIGIFGLVTLPSTLLNIIIFTIVAVYAISYIIKRPFVSNSKTLDILFLVLGGYINGTSLIGGPLIIAVFSTRVARHQLRDTLFMLWVILASIKLIGFISAGVDLQLIHHLWLLPSAAVGHFLGLRFYAYLQTTDESLFYQVLGVVLLLISIIGLVKAFT